MGAPLHRGDRRTILAVWLFVSVIFVASHFSFYFHEAHSELGDFAANALQIRNAKHFTELYGNYSRWGFHHPGPAFFYAYALGERVLFDLTKLVPSPYNAHALTGVVIQAFFFAWSLAILKRRVPHPLLIPLLLVFAGLHFGAVNYHLRDSAFEGIWPPHVLLFPFLCFVVACASVASGAGKDLIPAATTGALLVHGHVAQPLFVVPMFTMAYLALVIGQARTNGVSRSQVIRSFLRPQLMAGLIIALFLIPIVLDATRGEASNLSDILRHFGTHSDDRKSAGSSLLYLVSFFCYLPQPENYVEPLRNESWQFLRDRWYFVAIWITLLSAAVVLVATTIRKPSPYQGFLRALSVTFGMALLLTFAWGVLQNGPMLNFNSHFNFGLIFVILILLTISLCHFVKGEHVITKFALYLAAIPLFVACAWSGHFDEEMRDVHRNMTTFPIAEAAAEDSSAPRTKLLIFEETDWPWIAGVAISLKRAGYDFAVTQQWKVIFGKKQVVSPARALRKGKVALWRVEQNSTGGRGFPLRGGSFLTTAPPKIDPNGSEISFSGEAANAAAFAVTGWHLSHGEFTWSNAKDALLCFEPKRATSDVEIIFDIFPAVFPSHKSQRIAIALNETEPSYFECYEAETLKIRVPRESWNGQGTPANLSFSFPDAVTPAALGVSEDTRTLGFGFRKISFRQLP